MEALAENIYLLMKYCHKFLQKANSNSLETIEYKELSKTLKECIINCLEYREFPE